MSNTFFDSGTQEFPELGGGSAFFPPVFALRKWDFFGQCNFYQHIHSTYQYLKENKLYCLDRKKYVKTNILHLPTFSQNEAFPLSLITL